MTMIIIDATNNYEKCNNKNKSNFKINTKKSVYIVGDSMVKEVNGL